MNTIRPVPHCPKWEHLHHPCWEHPVEVSFHHRLVRTNVGMPPVCMEDVCHIDDHRNVIIKRILRMSCWGSFITIDVRPLREPSMPWHRRCKKRLPIVLPNFKKLFRNSYCRHHPRRLHVNHTTKIIQRWTTTTTTTTPRNLLLLPRRHCRRGPHVLRERGTVYGNIGLYRLETNESGCDSWWVKLPARD